MAACGWRKPQPGPGVVGLDATAGSLLDDARFPVSVRQLLTHVSGLPDYGNGWAYSKTGYLLLRQILDRHGGLAALLPALGFTAAAVAENLPDLSCAVPAHSALIGGAPAGTTPAGSVTAPW